MFVISLDELLEYPFRASVLLTDFVLVVFLAFLRPPLIVAALLVLILVNVSTFFGSRFASSGRK